MTRNVYDQAARYAAKLDAVGFVRWLDTRRLPFPGEADRICDTVACLEDPAVPGVLWAVPVEFALEPESELFGRLLAYLGLLWLEERPSDERGARYEVGAGVVNLTGRGHTSRDMSLAGMRTCLKVEERDLAGEDAAVVLSGMASGAVAHCLLPFVPLMQGGAEAGIIQQWLQLASAEPDARRRGDYAGLALVFAEAANCRPVWQQALQGWNVVQSQQVLEWMAEAAVKERADTLLEILDLKFGPIPAEVGSAIRATSDLPRLKQWVAAAVTASTLDVFRQGAQLGGRTGRLAAGKGTTAQTRVSRSEFAHEGSVRSVLIVLELKFQSIPQDLVNAVSSTWDFDKLDRWFHAAMVAASLADFRQATNL